MATESIEALLREITRRDEQWPSYATVDGYTKDTGGRTLLNCTLQPSGIAVVARPAHAALHAKGGVFSPFPIGSTIVVVFIAGDQNRGIAFSGVMNSQQEVPDGVYDEHILIKDEKLDLEADLTRIHGGGDTQPVVTEDILAAISDLCQLVLAVNNAVGSGTVNEPSAVVPPYGTTGKPNVLDTRVGDTSAATDLIADIAAGKYHTTKLEAE